MARPSRWCPNSRSHSGWRELTPDERAAIEATGVRVTPSMVVCTACGSVERGQASGYDSWRLAQHEPTAHPVPGFDTRGAQDDDSDDETAMVTYECGCVAAPDGALYQRCALSSVDPASCVYAAQAMAMAKP